MTRQRYHQLRRAVEAARAIAPAIIPFADRLNYDAIENRISPADDRLDDLDAADNRGGLPERNRVAREWEARGGA